MARALPNTKIPIADPDRTALPGLRRAAMRRYLRDQLRDLDYEIEALLDVQMGETWHKLERAAWSQPAAAQIVWTARLELYYLHAVREALVEALSHA